MSWGNPMPAGWRDDFRGMQKPDVRPFDDLSRFVMDRIMFTEREPAAEVPQVYNQPVGPMAHRYAAAVRRDMVAFRRVVQMYVDAQGAVESAEDDYERDAEEDRALGLKQAVATIAMRWDDHPDFRQEWKL